MHWDCFLQVLRTHRKEDLINLGLDKVWKTYKNPSELDPNDFKLNMGIIPRIVLLSIAYCNDKLFLPCPNYQKLIHYYDKVDIPRIALEKVICSLQNPVRKINSDDKKSREELVQHLSSIPVERVFDSIAELRFSNLMVGRDIVDIETIYTAWKILSSIIEKNKNGNELIVSIEKTLGSRPVTFLRGCLGLLTFAAQRNGRINLKGVFYDENFSKIWDVGDEDFYLIALNKLAAYDIANPTELRDYIESVESSYRPFFSSPLFTTPLIRINKHEFLMPDPIAFLRACSNQLLLAPTASKTTGIDSSEIGGFIEEHITEALQHIFGELKVKKISKSNSKHADLVINLNKCTLVIEIKKQLASNPKQFEMKASDLADMWSDAFGALRQLAESVIAEKNNGSDKIIIPVVIYFDPIGLCLEPFKNLLKEANILTKLSLEHLEIWSWPVLEDLLCRFTLEDFETRIINLYPGRHSPQEDSIALRPLLKDGSAANDLKYLEKSRKDILRHLKVIS